MCSISTSFGAIDNGVSNITTGGILKVDTNTSSVPSSSVSGVNAAGSLTLGSQNAAGLYVYTNDLYIENQFNDKDIIFRVCDGGTYTEVARFDGSEASLLMAENKKIQLGGTATYLYGNGSEIVIGANRVDFNNSIF